MIWNREHDVLIARVAEGRDVHKGADWMGEKHLGMDRNPMDYYWVYERPDGSGQCPVGVSSYNTDIAACLRAAEALCLQSPKDRSRSFTTRYRTSPGLDKATAIFEEHGDHGQVHHRVTWQGPTICEAAARSLYAACEGNL